MTKEKKSPKPLTAAQYTTRFKTLNKQYHARVAALAKQAMDNVIVPFCAAHTFGFRVTTDADAYGFVDAAGAVQRFEGTVAPDGYIDVYTVLQTPVFDGTRLFQHMSDYDPSRG